MKKIFFIFLLVCFVFAIGEQPIKNNNIGTQASVINPPNKLELKKLLDQDINSSEKFSSLIIDLNKLQYLSSIEIFKPQQIQGISISEDIVNWSGLITPNYSSNEKNSYALQGKPGRYIKVLPKDKEKEASCSEIAIYPYTDYELKFEDISTSTDATSCIVHIKTSVATLVQTIYGYNYDFIYNKKLDFSISTLSPGKEHLVKISDLLPATTYRYQIKVTDFNDKTIYSNFFTFTTKGAQKE